VGTAYHTSCRVWFTLSHGIVNKIYYPHVDQPNTRDFQFLISDGETFCHEEKRYSFAVALAEKFRTVKGRLSSTV
jgi:glucoamylase